MPLTYSRMPEDTSRWARWRSALTVPIRRRLQNAKGRARGITAKQCQGHPAVEPGEAYGRQHKADHNNRHWGSSC